MIRYNHTIPIPFLLPGLLARSSSLFFPFASSPPLLWQIAHFPQDTFDMRLLPNFRLMLLALSATVFLTSLTIASPIYRKDYNALVLKRDTAAGTGNIDSTLVTNVQKHGTSGAGSTLDIKANNANTSQATALPTPSAPATPNTPDSVSPPASPGATTTTPAATTVPASNPQNSDPANSTKSTTQSSNTSSSSVHPDTTANKDVLQAPSTQLPLTSDGGTSSTSPPSVPKTTDSKAQDPTQLPSSTAVASTPSNVTSDAASSTTNTSSTPTPPAATPASTDTVFTSYDQYRGNSTQSTFHPFLAEVDTLFSEESMREYGPAPYETRYRALDDSTGKFDVLKHWGNLSPYYSSPLYPNIQKYKALPANCKIKQVHMLHR